eukprot:1149349-Pelagomonas_calceolata.AAC.2
MRGQATLQPFKHVQQWPWQAAPVPTTAPVQCESVGCCLHTAQVSEKAGCTLGSMPFKNLCLRVMAPTLFLDRAQLTDLRIGR